MRSVLLGLMATTVVACGVFSSSDDAPAKEDPGLPPPSTPQDNSTPPPAVGGEAPVGVYVSSSQGQDDGSGSAVRPLKTLARAFALAKEKGLRVIACAEEYAENVTLLDGVSAYGYYDCKKTPWERGAPRAVVRAPATPAMVAKDITQPTRLEGFEVRSPDLDGAPATDDAGTSIALEVRGSTGLTVSEVLLHAGKGAPGTDGVEGPLNSRTATSNGTAAVDQHARSCPAFTEASGKCGTIGIPGPAGGTTTCAIGPSGGPGGQGGDGRIWVGFTQGEKTGEQKGRPLVATAATGVGGLNENASGLGKGLAALRGANGAEGPDGQNGAWSLTATGFTRGNGTAGGPGMPGQGGGGGAGSSGYFQSSGVLTSPPEGLPYYATATGGGGGGGGCGGQPGTPATGGGASIGALVIASAVTFERSRIETSAGGRAGKGNLGTSGIVGGTGGQGTVHTISTTGKGGDGGSGGHGGASGHGAPGPSIALAYSTKKPTLTEVRSGAGPGGCGPAAALEAGGRPGRNEAAARGDRGVGSGARDHAVRGWRGACRLRDVARTS